jgi:hypothetical protein
MSVSLKIRAHHLLCFQGYQGYGYSKEFQDNLERIIKLINTDPDLEMEVIAEKDMICSCCPYMVKTDCQRNQYSARMVRLIDLKVLEKLNLKEGVREKAQNIIALTNTNIKNFDDIQEICGDCQWREKCLFAQKITT